MEECARGERREEREREKSAHAAGILHSIPRHRHLNCVARSRPISVEMCRAVCVRVCMVVLQHACVVNWPVGWDTPGLRVCRPPVHVII